MVMSKKNFIIFLIFVCKDFFKYCWAIFFFIRRKCLSLLERSDFAFSHRQARRFLLWTDRIFSHMLRNRFSLVGRQIFLSYGKPFFFYLIPIMQYGVIIFHLQAFTLFYYEYARFSTYLYLCFVLLFAVIFFYGETSFYFLIWVDVFFSQVAQFSFLI